MAFEITRQEILKQAIELKKLYETTRIQKYKDEELRLRRIAVELEAFTSGSGGVSQIVAGTNITVSPTGGTGAVTINATTPTLDQVTTAGNTTSNTIDVGGITTDYVQFDTIATPTPVVGMMSWDTDRSTVSVQLDSDVDAHLGQDNFWYVKNQSGSTIPKGKAVMAVGTLGASGRILIDEMVANGSVSAKYLLGVTAEDIANGADGFVINIGKLRQIDTSMYSAGAVLYCDPSSPGNFTTTLPSAPNLKLPIAFVVHSAANGTLAIRVNIGSDLYEDHRVQVNTGSLADGQLLRYDSTDQRWENWTPNFLTSVPTLDQVTTAGNTTTNAITVGGLTVDTDTLVVDATNNRVGINTTTPTERLEVGSSSISNTKIKIVSNGFGTTTGLEIVRGSSVWNIVNSGNLSIVRGGVSVLTASASLNVLIGTTTDAGFKLDVNGDVRISGSGSTSGSNALTIRNSSGTSLFRVSNIGFTFIETVSSQAYLQIGGSSLYYVSTTSKLDFNTSVRTFNLFSNVSTGDYSFNITNNTTYTGTVENINHLNIFSTFAPTSGTSTISYTVIRPTINQTGGANGITRGLYVNPTLTSAYDFRAIETSAGKVIHQGLTAATQTNQVYYNTTTGELTYGALPTVATPTLDQVTTAGNTTNNNIGLGTTPTYKLDVFGTGGNGGVSSNVGFNIQPVDPPNITGMTYTLLPGTALSVGRYWYHIIYYNAIGETSRSTSFQVDTTSGNQIVQLNNIPVSTNPSVIGRNIYRGKVGDSASYGAKIGTITNNVDTTFVDSISDSDPIIPSQVLDRPIFGKPNTTSKYISVFGVRSMIVDSVGLTTFGYQAGEDIISAGNTTLFGYRAGANITTRGGNTLFGYNAGASITTGAQNVGMGDNALVGVTTGSYNVGLGPNVLQRDGSFNIAFGYYTGQATTGNNNVMIGSYIGSSTLSMSDSIIIGHNATPLASTNNQINIGNTIYGRRNTGNVQIGTTTDAGYKLDVNGDVRVQRVYSNIIRDSNGNNIISTNVINISNTDTQIGTGTTNTITLNTKSSGGVYIPAGNVGIGTITPTYKLQVNGTVSAQLTNATHTSQVYYNTTTGELTYGALPTVATPTLDQVTTAGNTTTNAVTIGGLTVTGMIEVFKVGSSVEFRSLDSNINFLGKSDNTGGVNFYGGGAYNTGGGISVTGNSNLNPSSIYFFRDAFTQNGRFFSSGNLLLGSGSTDAGYKLDVSGTIRSSGVITASGGTSTDWNAAYSWGNHATAGYLTGTTGYTGIFTVPTNPPGQQNLDIVNGLIVNVF